MMVRPRGRRPIACGFRIAFRSCTRSILCSKLYSKFFPRHVLSRATILRFLKPTFVSCACYLVALGVVVSWIRPIDHQSVGESTEGDFREDRDLIVKPSRDLDVEDVIRIQLNGLSDEQPERGIAQCMEFASPANRSVSGSIDEFARLVRNERYRVLADPDAVQIGSATATDSHVQVLVTVVNDGLVRSFMWVLSRQTEPPYGGCWMTDGVFPMDEEPKPDDVIASPPVTRMRRNTADFLSDFTCFAI